MSPDSNLTVAVDGHLKAAEAPIERALTLLWQAVRGLPISGYQERYLRRLLGSGSTLGVEQMLDRDGTVELPLDLGEAGMTTIRIWRGDGRTRAQRVVDRYAVEELVAGPRGGRAWGLRDAETGELVTDDEGTLREFSTQSGAEEWRRRQGYLAGYRNMPNVGAAR
ncbi:MAG: hypothetical protein HOY79_03205 [Streptomyces sp.]|nr:hypothetical protein [Streptomyces sp.]